MGDAVAHRGRDGHGRLVRGPLGVVHYRLAIFDPTPRSRQPMVDADRGLTLVYNGALYEHETLRDELSGRGHAFATTSDTEVLLAAYAEWGSDCVSHLQGQFAFAIHDAKAERLVLARDPMGIKPLYVARVPGGVRFASTLPSLVAGGDVDTSVDPVALHHYLTLHGIVPAPRTILRGVAKLEPGQIVEVDHDGRQRARTYWSYPTPRPDAAVGVEALTSSLRTALSRRLAGDADVAVLLSGGLDSSLLVALAHEAHAGPLDTFSVGFDGDAEVRGDEFEYSDLVARRYGTRHHQLRVSAAQVHAGVDDCIAAMSEPMLSHDAVAFMLLSRQVAGSHRVVLSGQGADEVFAGYHWYARLAATRGTDPLLAYAGEFFDRPHAGVLQILAPDLRGPDETTAWLRGVARPLGPDATPVETALWIDGAQMLAGDPLLRVDSMMMSSAVEARLPFLDLDVLQVAAAIPVADKLASGGKGVLKQVARAWLPDVLIDRPKAYFPVPALMRPSGWLTHVRDAIASPRARARGLWNRDRVDAWLRDPQAERSSMGVGGLWQIGVLERWFSHLGL
jgi:asparagine synthase (glutamine-hydrolysing)